MPGNLQNKEAMDEYVMQKLYGMHTETRLRKKSYIEGKNYETSACGNAAPPAMNHYKCIRCKDKVKVNIWLSNA